MTSIEEHRLRLIEDEDYRAQISEKEAAMAFEIRRSIEGTKVSRREADEIFDDDWEE